MRAKGLDLADAVHRKAIGNRLIHSLRMQQHQGRVSARGEAERRQCVAPSRYVLV